MGCEHTIDNVMEQGDSEKSSEDSSQLHLAENQSANEPDDEIENENDSSVDASHTSTERASVHLGTKVQEDRPARPSASSRPNTVLSLGSNSSKVGKRAEICNYAKYVM